MPLPLLLNEFAITPILTLLVEAQLHPSISIVALKKSCVPSLSFLNDFVMTPFPILWFPETSNIKKLVSEYLIQTMPGTQREFQKCLKQYFPCPNSQYLKKSNAGENRTIFTFTTGMEKKKIIRETTIAHPKPLKHNAKIEEELSTTISSIT